MYSTYSIVYPITYSLLSIISIPPASAKSNASMPWSHENMLVGQHKNSWAPCVRKRWSGTTWTWFVSGLTERAGERKSGDTGGNGKRECWE